jgi:hypothetical protein
MSTIIRPSINFLPEKQAEAELFKKVSDMVDHEIEKFASALNDVASKYTDPSSVTREVVTEVFRENGLKSVVDLLNNVNVVDYNTVLAFSAYVTLLKGSRTGYETVLRLIGFTYTLKEWWEEGGSGIPNTFSIDIDLNASQTSKPYETFQKFKKFTSEYVFPIVHPLGYTYVIDFRGPQISCHGAAGVILDSLAADSVSKDDVFGPSNWIVKDEEGQSWVIKINSSGQLKVFKTDREPYVFINLISDNGGLYYPFVNNDGELSLELTSVTRTAHPFVHLMGHDKTGWFVYVTGFGDFTVSSSYTSYDTLNTESFEVLLQESGGILGF